MQFNYRAINNDGTVVTGSTSGETLRSVARRLRQQGLQVTSLEQGKIVGKKMSIRFSNGKASNQEVVIFIHQLAVLLESGMPIDEAVWSLAESVEHPLLAKQCGELGAVLRRGSSFSEALRKSELAIPTYFYPLTEAAELTGKLAGALRDGITQWEYELKTRKDIVGSLIYPAILVMSGIGSIGVIFLLVVPKFSKMLNNSKIELPFLAKMVLGTSKFINEHLFFIGGMILTTILLLYLLFSNKANRQRFWNFLATLPIVGNWLKEADIGRWAAMLATLLENRVELLYAMELAQKGVILSVLKSSFTYATKTVGEGATLSRALGDRAILSNMAVNLIKVGENSGELASMLRTLARLYDDSVKTRMQRFLILIEPIAILLIGSVVGVIMAGIILAITSVNEITL